MKWVKAFAPATVANVCCGFDILGFAINQPGDEVHARLSARPGVVITRITGDGGKLPVATDKNTAGVAVLSFLKAIGKENSGIEMELHKNLPLGSGMGSSAASAAAALVAVNELMGKPLSKSQLVPFGMESERVACGSAHADNVAPSLMGGIVLMRDYQPLDLIQVPYPSNLCCTLVHPHLEVRTEDSRRILRNAVQLKDAISQAANAAGLMVGLIQSDFRLIADSLKDTIAEPVRSFFIPGFDELKEKAKKAGALGAGISGSGPTVFALCDDGQVAERVGQTMSQHFIQMGLTCDLFISNVNREGARILDQG
jgi:homoserine kinase